MIPYDIYDMPHPANQVKFIQGVYSGSGEGANFSFRHYPLEEKKCHWNSKFELKWKLINTFCLYWRGDSDPVNEILKIIEMKSFNEI